VFGNDAPPKGWFYTGPDPLGEFIKYKRGPKVNLTSQQDRQNYIEYFVRNGYILVFKQGNTFNIYSRENMHMPQDGVKALEMTMGLTPDTMVNWGGRSMKAAKLIYGQPERQEPRQQYRWPKPAPKPQPMAKAAVPTAAPAQPSGTDKIKATFGGGYGEAGEFTSGPTVNVQLMKKLLKEGHAFVIKYPSGSFNVIIPERYQFKDEAIMEMEKQMGLKPTSRVQWFIGAINPNEAIQTTAAEAIYGDKV
jgi:hypothetical protein